MYRVVYVIWQEIPERTAIYKLTVVNAEEMSRLRLCHGNYINTTLPNVQTEEALNWLNERLRSAELVFSSDSEDNFLIEPDTIDAIVVTGFIL